MDRGQIPQEPSFLAMELRRTAEGLHLAYEEFKRAGFTRREAMEFTRMFYQRVLQG